MQIWKKQREYRKINKREVKKTPKKTKDKKGRNFSVLRKSNKFTKLKSKKLKQNFIH